MKALGKQDDKREWSQCKSLMCAVCEGEDVASARDVASLTQEVERQEDEGWQVVMAAEKQRIVAHVTQLGCEIFKVARVAAAFVTYPERRPTAPCCVIQE